MATIANGAVSSVPPLEISITKQDKRQYEIKRGGQSVGWCVPLYDGRGFWHGWQAIANQPPRRGFSCAYVREFKKLKQALSFVMDTGVAL